MKSEGTIRKPTTLTKIRVIEIGIAIKRNLDFFVSVHKMVI
jgi:hypothetical protein